MDATARTTASTAAPTLADYARHSAYSDPGPHADLLAAVAPDRAEIGRAACATIVHYRAGGVPLRDEQRADIDRWWLASTLDAATERRPGPLTEGRAPGQMVAGCCRDHTLFSLAVLRQHGVPARSRIGFAAYFEPPFFHDHVVVEHWDAAGERWVRWDPELTPDGSWEFDVRDMPTGPASPFPTAAEVWRAIRAGEVDPASYGVGPELPELCGKDFVRGYVMLELAHRMRDEVLLWDVWGVVPDDVPGVAALWAQAREDGPEPSSASAPEPTSEELDALADELAALLVAADAGDPAAEAALAARYAGRWAARGLVTTLSPTGRVGITDLRGRATTWA
ncbi:transglutaminase domain-containing protein [Krasilnikoviella flava]|uniref:Transglutaminase-like superfamily protein n=1 Tax=Krasilnikoviella flava TaxID=526729 RepID=A0A1T5IRF0_9MICO|nr:transglutaminase domain-containing protein [Krasilnikoviella flava]SKC41730.1 Transglutaminase-like superfamily protein [Krasilnikoviella flava]